jgi:cytoskeletal protein CcmA (bactofilin family)
MMRRRPNENEAQEREEDKYLDVNAAMQGSLRFDDPVNLRISGKFEGMLDTKGNLVIGQKAEIKADITGECIEIAGSVMGNIKASKILRMKSSARLDGDVETAKLSIEEGAVLIGRVRMETGGTLGVQSQETNIMDINQVARYLEVDLGKVSDWVNNGMLPGVSRNGAWIFDKRKIDEWIAQGKTRR